MVDASPGVLASNALTARWVEVAGQHRGDFALSGAVVWRLLAALAAGAVGDARDELERSSGVSADRALAAAVEVIGGIDRAGGAQAAIGLWLREGVPLRSDWTSALPESARGLLHGLPEQDQATLDAWVKERTLGILARLPARIDERTLLLLAACLAIRTDWQTRFMSSRVPWEVPSGPWAGRSLYRLSARFYDLDRVTIVDSRVGELTIFDSLGADDIDVHLVIGRPDRSPGDVLGEGIAALAGERPWRGVDDLRPGYTAPVVTVDETVTDYRSETYVWIDTVAFEVSAEHDLRRHADLFGLRTASDASRGHFPGISDAPLAIQQAGQSVRATFSAKGFEAAAVAYVGMQPGAAGGRSVNTYIRRVIKVAFARPFGFIALDRSSRLVLVAGWVENPTPHPNADEFEKHRRAPAGPSYTTGLGPEGQEEGS